MCLCLNAVYVCLFFRPYCDSCNWTKSKFFFFLFQNFILLFKELPLHLWLPESHDMHVIHNMLMEFPLSSCENLLARVILSGLNWGTKSEVCKLWMKSTECIMELNISILDGTQPFVSSYTHTCPTCSFEATVHILYLQYYWYLNNIVILCPYTYHL